MYYSEMKINKTAFELKRDLIFSFLLIKYCINKQTNKNETT